MDSKNEVKKEQKNILKKIYYVLTYGISLSLIVFSIIVYDYMKFRVFYSVILFCVFLIPDIYKLIKNKKNLVYFELTDERQIYNKLNIYPEVNSLLSVSIYVKKIKIKKQTFNKFVRNGFTAVEWGA